MAHLPTLIVYLLSLLDQQRAENEELKRLHEIDEGQIELRDNAFAKLSEQLRAAQDAEQGGSK